MVRAQQRDFSRSGGRSSDMRPLAEFFTRVSGASAASASFWTRDVVGGVALRFGRCALDEAERAPGALQRACRGELFAIISGVMRRTGVRLRADVAAQLAAQLSPPPRRRPHVAHATSRARADGVASAAAEDAADAERWHVFEFLASDFDSVAPTTQHMQHVDFAEGMHLSLLSQAADAARDVRVDAAAAHRDGAAPTIVSRHAKLACRYLRCALRAVPGDTRARFALADAWQTRALAAGAAQHCGCVAQRPFTRTGPYAAFRHPHSRVHARTLLSRPQVRALSRAARRGARHR
jgi:hypothetical protein